MNLNEILKVTNGTCDLKKSKIKDIKIDSRDLKKHDLFIALKGDNFDGHEFVNDKNLSIVSKDVESKNIIKVKDTYDALYNISKYIKQKVNPKVVAITGSVGKTMTKELIYEILKTKYKTLKTEGNNNNHIGVPKTLLKLKDEEFLVTELGMNHKGEIEKLSNLVNPNIGVITNIGSSHIGNLKNKKNIFKAKLEITKGMDKGILVVNGDDEYLKKIKLKNISVIKCGINSNNDLKAYNIYSNLEKTLFNVKINNEEYLITLNVPGKHLITNALLAIQVGLLNNVKIEDIIKVIENYKYISNRLNIYKKDFVLIDDCYNASYESIIGALNLIKDEKQDKIIILGDILELGKKTKYYYKKISKCLKKLENSEVLLVGANMKLLKDYKHFNNNLEVIEYLKDKNLYNKIILVKASRKMELEIISEYLKNC